MTSLLPNPVNNFAKRVHKIKCKFVHNEKKYKTCGIKYEDCECFLKYTNIKNNSIECKCLCCNKNY